MERTITLRVMDRPDGGLRICSDDLPGLVLSSLDHDALWCDLGLAIKVLLTYDAEQCAENAHCSSQ